DIVAIRSNDRLREQFLETHRDFVRRYASFVARKPLDWRNDDELSVALIAFNDAIDTFDPASGAGFTGYAKVVIRRRLIDYFRKQAAKAPECAIPEGFDLPDARATAEIERLDRAFEMEHFERRMEEFGITLADLVANSPAHRGTRETLKRLAVSVARRKEIIERLLETRQLPIKEILAAEGVSRKVLETWRKYLISAIVIAADYEFESMREFVFGDQRQGGSGSDGVA
ncbi:MAG: sigma factor, partial [Bacillota bacterium]